MADSKPGDPPADATNGRSAQDHEYADVETGGRPQPGRYPADGIEERDGGDVTPDASDPHVEWDERVQPERPDERDPESDNESEGT